MTDKKATRRKAIAYGSLGLVGITGMSNITAANSVNSETFSESHPNIKNSSTGYTVSEGFDDAEIDLASADIGLTVAVPSSSRNSLADLNISWGIDGKDDNSSWTEVRDLTVDIKPVGSNPDDHNFSSTIETCGPGDSEDLATDGLEAAVEHLVDEFASLGAVPNPITVLNMANGSSIDTETSNGQDELHIHHDGTLRGDDGGGVNTEISLGVGPGIPGTYEFEAELTASVDYITSSGRSDVGDIDITVPFEVEWEDDWWEPYTDSNDIVQTDGLRSATDDWRDGIISTSQLRNLTESWREEKPMSEVV